MSNLVWSLATIRENHEPLMNAVSSGAPRGLQKGFPRFLQRFSSFFDKASEGKNPKLKV